MPCKVIQLPGGATALVKLPAARARKCSVCHERVFHFQLCDYPIHAARTDLCDDGMTVDLPAKTCDKVLCSQCAVHVPPDEDYCPLHAAVLRIGGRRLRL